MSDEEAEQGYWMLTEPAINKALGEEVERARKAAGFSTRSGVAEKLPFPCTLTSLTNWETGQRGIAYGKLVEMARLFGTTAPELLRRAIERLETIQSLMVQFDLEPVCKINDTRYALLRSWAEKKRKMLPGSKTVVRVHHSFIRELALMLNMSPSGLVNLLRREAFFCEVRDEPL